VVHLVRNSLRYASKADWAQVTRAMKAIYTAPTVEAAETQMLEFSERWAAKYPAMVAAWERAWPEFVPFLAFPVEIRKLIYTTNAIESLNARFRRAVRRRGHFPNDQAALKVLYLTIRERVPNKTNPVGQVNGWKSILNALTIHYGDRLAVH
jgi:putative transposase